jgi:hypothetical protein
MEEITLGTGLSYTGTTLNVTGASATISIGSTITSGTNGSVLFVGSGQLQQDNTNFFFDNANDRLSIAGGTSPGARLQLGAGTGAVPHLILTPTSAATISGTTNGSLWVDTASSNTSITMRKDSNYKKIVTIDRNPDLATSGTALLQADSNGTISKGSELTALGIFASSDSTTLANTVTTATTIISSSLVGSKTLPANFFGVGKTIEFKASGTFTLDNSNTFRFRTSIGILNIDITLDHNNNISGRYWDYVCRVTCKAISGTNSTYIYSAQVTAQHDANGGGIIFGTAADSGSLAINTGATIAVDMLGNFDANTAGNTLTAFQDTSTYLN